MLKYTKGQWSWKFIDGNKPVISIIEDKSGHEINSLQMGDMELIINAPVMFELLRKIAFSVSQGNLVEEARQLLHRMNIELGG